MNSPVTGEFPAQGASNANIIPFDDVIMKTDVFVYVTPQISSASSGVANNNCSHTKEKNG